MSISPGALRFNTDSQKLELFDGNQWTEIVATSPEAQTGGARGVFGGGYTAPATSFNVIQYINISSTGNAIDFGDLSAARGGMSACSSSTRGVFSGGTVVSAPYPKTNVIEFITISSTGNAQDFGDLSVAKQTAAACSSSTRGVFGGGYTNTPAATVFNVIEYITIASTGNAQDFGDLSAGKSSLSACSSSTRGVFGGGAPTPTLTNVIEFITISTLGNASDFGDLSVAKNALSACSSSTRGVFGGGATPTLTNVIEFITISTLGNASDFGDLLSALRQKAALSSSTRGVFAGGYTPETNVIEFITILTTGNAIDFGDLIANNT
jgi:hypothetical protein